MSGLFLCGVGVALLVIGGLGLWRFPDLYSRLQGAGVGETGGALLFLVGLLVHTGHLDGVAILLLALLLFTGPIVTHSIAKGAFVRRERVEP
ncbi:MAG TPA: sodium:proton antiporter [Candidatus Acetothermia bacterium]|nr:sodium:proton antiporter [Candidatus Acetothermia bacterium]